MTQIVIPFRGENGKRRLDAPDEARAELGLAMLGDVLAAATVIGRTLVVTDDKAGRALAADLGAEPVADVRGGQGASVAAALGGLDGGTMLVVNADLPCVVPHDLRTLAGAADLGAIAYVEAEDGTTNALALPGKEHFAPLYGGGSAARFRDHADSIGVPAISCAIPNLSDDVDTLDDLRRISLRAGPRTQAAIGRILQP
ncbi:MAG TPA: NTP transferase domain-containing protein [Gaiellaceae bacterium]|nr:NTP transferase domain-containing protein [Gaiellaceae bacterium]